MMSSPRCLRWNVHMTQPKIVESYAVFDNVDNKFAFTPFWLGLPFIT